MKRFADIFGLFVAAIIAISAFIKANHLPGSGLLFIFSLGLLLPLYFLFTLIVRFKEKKGAVGLIAPGIFAGIFVLGVLFSIMHWPGGVALSYLGFLILVLILFILTLVNTFRKTGEQKLSPTILIFTIIAISLVYAGMSKSVSKGNLVSNFLAADNETKVCNYIKLQNSSLFDQVDSTRKPTLQRFRNRATELANFIEEVKDRVLLDANDQQPYKSYADIKHIDATDIADHILERNNYTNELKIKIDQLKNEIDQLPLNQSEKTSLLKRFDFRELEKFSANGDWTEAYFKHATVISVVATLAALQAKVLMCENSVYNQFTYKRRCF